MIFVNNTKWSSYQSYHLNKFLLLTMHPVALFYWFFTSFVANVFVELNVSYGFLIFILNRIEAIKLFITIETYYAEKKNCMAHQNNVLNYYCTTL